MPRSDEAIRRRAAKRQRTDDEQRAFDRKDMKMAEKKKKRSQSNSSVSSSLPPNPTDPSSPDHNNNINNENDPLRELGAWKCPGCGNENFASRNWCNSKTCDERRPDHIPAPVSRPTNMKRPKVDLTNHSQPNALDEEGAWTCPTCQFPNFASRERCKGFQCQQRRPTPGSSSVTWPPRQQLQQQLQKQEQHNPRHDPETSKVVVWSKQADVTTLNKNQVLRRRYQETEGEGMSAEEIQRAKILIARDERKRQKKLKNHGTEEEEEESTLPQDVIVSASSSLQDPIASKTTTATPTATATTLEVVPIPVDPKIQRKRNKALRKRYVATGGEGMTEEDMERAKVLIARDERKRQKVQSLVATTTGEN